MLWLQATKTACSLVLHWRQPWSSLWLVDVEANWATKVDGKLSESSLDLLSGVVAEMKLLKKTSPTRLVFVVNKCTLNYGADALERALGPNGRHPEVRDAFSERRFIAVPFDEPLAFTTQFCCNLSKGPEEKAIKER